MRGNCPGRLEGLGVRSLGILQRVLQGPNLLDRILELRDLILQLFILQRDSLGWVPRESTAIVGHLDRVVETASFLDRDLLEVELMSGREILFPDLRSEIHWKTKLFFAAVGFLQLGNDLCVLNSIVVGRAEADIESFVCLEGEVLGFLQKLDLWLLVRLSGHRDGKTRGQPAPFFRSGELNFRTETLVELGFETELFVVRQQRLDVFPRSLFHDDSGLRQGLVGSKRESYLAAFGSLESPR